MDTRSNTPNSIAIVGASGHVGSTLAAQILRMDLLPPGGRLQLVGHGAPAGESLLLGTRVDLLDAFDDEQVEIEVVPSASDVNADIVVIAAGVSLSTQCKNRRDLALQNRDLFESLAETCARTTPDSFFVVVSNPVELAVHLLSSKLDRFRVVGMGAQQDSLRFARAVANSLGISRHDVKATVAGEHGQAMVPLWSSVELLAPSGNLDEKLALLRLESEQKPLAERVATLHQQVGDLLQAGLISQAYAATGRELPDARIFVEPFITACSMHSTPNATANATLQVLAAALAQDGRRVHAQVQLQGELLGIHGVCGVPVTLDRGRWLCHNFEPLQEHERESIGNASASINEFLSFVLAANETLRMTTRCP